MSKLFSIFIKFLCASMVLGALSAGFWPIFWTIIIDIFIFKILVSSSTNLSGEELDAFSTLLRFVSIIAIIIGASMFFVGVDSAESVLSRDPCGICGGTRVFLGKLCKNCYGSGRETISITPQYTWNGCLIAVSGALFFFAGKFVSDNVNQEKETSATKCNTVQNNYRTEPEHNYSKEIASPKYVIQHNETIRNGVPIFRCQKCGRYQNLNKSTGVVKCIYCGTPHSVLQTEIATPIKEIKEERQHRSEAYFRTSEEIQQFHSNLLNVDAHRDNDCRNSSELTGKEKRLEDGEAKFRALQQSRAAMKEPSIEKTIIKQQNSSIPLDMSNEQHINNKEQRLEDGEAKFRALQQARAAAMKKQ